MLQENWNWRTNSFPTQGGLYNYKTTLSLIAVIGNLWSDTYYYLYPCTDICNCLAYEDEL